MSLRDDIERAVAANAGKSPFSPLPENPNRMGRPPRTIDLSDPDIVQALSQPGLPARLRLMQQDPDPEVRALVHELITDLKQVKRANENARSLPGAYNGDDSLPYLEMPFAARESHRPDRQPGSDAHKIMTAAVQQLDAHVIERGLASKMGTQEKVAAIEQREDAQEPSLRERVSAAVAVHAPTPT